MIVFIGELTSPQSLADKYAKLTGIEITVQKQQSGKPVLLSGSQKLYISVSHSKGLQVTAISRFEVGVDIEKVRDIAFDDIAKRFFANEEVPADKKDFFEMWTKKEAVHKMNGSNLLKTLKQNCSAQNFDFIKGYALAVAGQDSAVFFNFY